MGLSLNVWVKNHGINNRLYRNTKIKLFKLNQTTIQCIHTLNFYYKPIKQADARRRNLVQLRLFDRFDVCILQN